MRTYRYCFTGTEFLDWATQVDVVETRNDGLKLGNYFLLRGVLTQLDAGRGEEPIMSDSRTTFYTVGGMEFNQIFEIKVEPTIVERAITGVENIHKRHFFIALITFIGILVGSLSLSSYWHDEAHKMETEGIFSFNILQI